MLRSHVKSVFSHAYCWSVFLNVALIVEVSFLMLIVEVFSFLMLIVEVLSVKTINAISTDKVNRNNASNNNQYKQQQR